MTVGKRIADIRTDMGLSQTQFGERYGASKQTVSHWEADRNSPKSFTFSAIARDGKVSVEWLMTGKGPRERHGSNVSALVGDFGEVPIISSVQAGNWNPAADFLTQSEIRTIGCPVRHSAGTFGLVVEGDSMTASFGRTYPAGCVIFVDPEKRSPTNGDRIVAKLVGEDAVTFKVFIREAGKVWLKPLNPQHPPILDEFRVIGTVIGKWEDE